ncbi:hypothetical protein V2W45_690525 [Cenococcum geophilum]
MAYLHIHNMADAGEILLGVWGREVFRAAQTIFFIFSVGSHILTFTIAFNVMTGHATCTIAWGGGVIGMIVLWIFTLPRTLKKVSYLSVASFISIGAAVLMTGVGVSCSWSPLQCNHPHEPCQSLRQCLEHYLHLRRPRRIFLIHQRVQKSEGFP